ncbi:MAG: SPOR domain-containing protein [Nitrospiraceae bacterium]|nr:MAG: SPOR domain-containing protein [Nitrospiraceae bacterium]
MCKKEIIMLSVNRRSSRFKPVKEKNTALIISICIPVLLFALIILAVALPSILKKNNDKFENAALSRLETMSNNMDEEITARAPETKSIKKELPETDSNSIHTKESQDSAVMENMHGTDNTLSLVYTIQAGSFNDLNRAEKLYDFIVNELDSEDLAYLRIEKVGRYYAVRLGKFGEQRNAKIFLNKIMSHLSTLSMMKAYINTERIVKLHSS